MDQAQIQHHVLQLSVLLLLEVDLSPSPQHPGLHIHWLPVQVVVIQIGSLFLSAIFPAHMALSGENLNDLTIIKS